MINTPNIVAVIVFAQFMALWSMGQPLRPPHIKLWGGTKESSQHIFDWYSPSHFIHGLIFYGLTGSVVWAALIEAAWEVIENSPCVIARYRKTASVTYTGDTVLNSMCDTGCMLLGFWYASIASWDISLAVAVMWEIYTALAIRDNLTLNVIMLLHPFERIKAWQQKGPVQ